MDIEDEFFQSWIKNSEYVLKTLKQLLRCQAEIKRDFNIYKIAQAEKIQELKTTARIYNIIGGAIGGGVITLVVGLILWAVAKKMSIN